MHKYNVKEERRQNTHTHKHSQLLRSAGYVQNQPGVISPVLTVLGLL